MKKNIFFHFIQIFLKFYIYICDITFNYPPISLDSKIVYFIMYEFILHLFEKKYLGAS